MNYINNTLLVGGFLGVDLGCFSPKIGFGEFFILFWFPLCQFGFDGVFGENTLLKEGRGEQYFILKVYHLK